QGRFFASIERFFDWMLSAYKRSLSWALRFAPLMIVILFATIALNVYLYTIIPKGFFPQQDTGRLVGGIQGDQSISFQAMKIKLDSFVEIVKNDLNDTQLHIAEI
ncbi:MAG: efflux RND transporter permease subunit, partial [Glaciimonas sp.]|nr:efflux RND transporter permease subunit [Glaciimonas sp.]